MSSLLTCGRPILRPFALAFSIPDRTWTVGGEDWTEPNYHLLYIAKQMQTSLQRVTKKADTPMRYLLFYFIDYEMPSAAIE